MSCILYLASSDLPGVFGLSAARSQDTRTPRFQDLKTPGVLELWSRGPEDPRNPGPRLPHLQSSGSSSSSSSLSRLNEKRLNSSCVHTFFVANFELPNCPGPFGESRGATHRTVRWYCTNMLSPSRVKCQGLGYVLETFYDLAVLWGGADHQKGQSTTHSF